MTFRRFRQLVAVFLIFSVAACFGDVEPTLPDDAIQSHRGVWIGKSLHNTVGSVSVHRADGDALILIEANFSLSPIPGVVVALGRDGYRSGAVIGTLRRAQGRQVYLVPDGLRISDYNEIWLWDAANNRPIGLARLRGVGGA